MTIKLRYVNGGLYGSGALSPKYRMLLGGCHRTAPILIFGNGGTDFLGDLLPTKGPGVACLTFKKRLGDG